MSKVLVDIEGFAELQQKIKQLGNTKDKRREVLALLRKGAASTVRAARANAPVSKKPHVIGGSRTKKTVTPGSLKKSIGTITGKNKEQPTIYVGPRAKGNHLGFYGAWVEKGHNIYRSGFKRNRKGKRDYNAKGAKGTSKATPFMQKAATQTQGKVAQELEKNTAKFIQKKIDKLSK